MTQINIQDRRAAMHRFIDGCGESLNAWCRRATVAESAVRGFLSGRSESLSDRTYQKLAKAAGVSVAVLLGEAPQISEEDKQIIADLRALDPEVRQGYLDMLRAQARLVRERRMRED